ncbi:MAG: hypothetical protein DRO52_04275 [Candidatus Hecatellales archaeon]|nr:MAG: hypothetical protein DRO52_04275 [Candidatus Hecatellales archaeon]
MTSLKPNLLLVAYSELALKSPAVRRRLEMLLASQVRRKLERAGFKAGRGWKEGGRIFLTQDEAELSAPIAARVFGVEYVAPAVRVEASLEAMASKVQSLLEGRVEEGMRFAVRARRIGFHPYTSRDVEAEIGRRLLQAYPNLKVDLENPQLTIHVEVRGGNAYLYLDVFRGPGGLPLGSQGRALAILDGANAAAACWLAMRRGLHPILLIPSENQEKLRDTLKLAGRLASWTPQGSLKTYILTLSRTRGRLEEASPELRDLLYEMVKAHAGGSLAERLRVKALILGLNLKRGLEAELALLKALKGSLRQLVLTPLAALTEAAEAFKVLNLREELEAFPSSPKASRLSEVFESLKLWEALMEDLKGLREIRVEAEEA